MFATHANETNQQALPRELLPENKGDELARCTNSPTSSVTSLFDTEPMPALQQMLPLLHPTSPIPAPAATGRYAFGPREGTVGPMVIKREPVSAAAAATSPAGLVRSASPTTTATSTGSARLTKQGKPYKQWTDAETAKHTKFFNDWQQKENCKISSDFYKRHAAEIALLLVEFGCTLEAFQTKFNNGRHNSVLQNAEFQRRTPIELMVQLQMKADNLRAAAATDANNSAQDALAALPVPTMEQLDFADWAMIGERAGYLGHSCSGLYEKGEKRKTAPVEKRPREGDVAGARPVAQRVKTSDTGMVRAVRAVVKTESRNANAAAAAAIPAMVDFVPAAVRRDEQFMLDAVCDVLPEARPVDAATVRMTPMNTTTDEQPIRARGPLQLNWLIDDAQHCVFEMDEGVPAAVRVEMLPQRAVQLTALFTARVAEQVHECRSPSDTIQHASRLLSTMAKWPLVENHVPDTLATTTTGLSSIKFYLDAFYQSVLRLCQDEVWKGELESFHSLYQQLTCTRVA